MAQKAIEGKNVLLRAKRGDEYVPFVCATSVDFTYDTELIAKTTVNSAGFRQYAARLGEWGLTLSTVTHIVSPNSDNAYTVFDTMTEQARKTGMDIELIFQDNDGNLKTITGHVLIPHTGISSPVEGFSEDEIEFKGSGAFEINTELITPTVNNSQVYSKDYTAAGGETTITFSDLIGKEILNVQRDGIGKDVIAVGTPNDKQVKFLTASGTFSFSTELGLDEWVLILYK
jgi:hypothetical protein